MTFADGESRLVTKLSRPVVSSREDIEWDKKLVRQKHKKMVDEPDTTPPVGRRLSALANFGARFSQPSPEAVARFNAEMERFYAEYDRWLETKDVHRAREILTVPLPFVLSNTGTAPAEDIDVFFHFPDGFRLSSGRDRPCSPEEPTPPERPLGGLADLAFRLPTLAPAIPPLSALQHVARNVSSPSIERTNSYDVNIHVKNLKHQLTEDLGTLYAVFESFDAAASFSIDYRLVTANVPKPVAGKLHVVVEK